MHHDARDKTDVFASLLNGVFVEYYSIEEPMGVPVSRSNFSVHLGRVNPCLAEARVCSALPTVRWKVMEPNKPKPLFWSLNHSLSALDWY